MWIGLTQAAVKISAGSQRHRMTTSAVASVNRLAVILTQETTPRLP